MKDTAAPPARQREVREYTLNSPPAVDTVTIGKCGPNAIRIPKPRKKKGESPIRNAPQGRPGSLSGGWTQNSRRSVRRYAGFYEDRFRCLVTLNYLEEPTCDGLKAHRLDIRRWLKRNWKDADFLGVIEFKEKSHRRAGFPHFHIALDVAPDDSTADSLRQWWSSKTKGEAHIDARPDSDPKKISRYLAKSEQKDNPPWWETRCSPWFTNLSKPEVTDTVEMPREAAARAGLMRHTLTHDGAVILDTVKQAGLSQFGTIEEGMPNQDNADVPNRNNAPSDYEELTRDQWRLKSCPTCWDRFCRYMPKLDHDTCPKCGRNHHPETSVTVGDGDSPIEITINATQDIDAILKEIHQAVITHPGTHPLHITLSREDGGSILFKSSMRVSGDLIAVPVVSSRLMSSSHDS